MQFTIRERESVPTGSVVTPDALMHLDLVGTTSNMVGRRPGLLEFGHRKVSACWSRF
jgi:hypothetical protein